jgi:hypothetical protein
MRVLRYHASRVSALHSYYSVVPHSILTTPLFIDGVSSLKVAAAAQGVEGAQPPPVPPLPKLPVMIYFPAGQFMWGSGNDAENFNAPQTAAGAEVIVVTMNYRLGAMGYLARTSLTLCLMLTLTGTYIPNHVPNSNPCLFADPNQCPLVSP